MLQLPVLIAEGGQDGPPMTTPAKRRLLVSALAALLGRLLMTLGARHRINSELERRNLELERAGRAKSRLVANLSHELRTPLNAVIGFSELIQTGRSGQVSSAQHEQLGIIRASADHLLRLISEGLDLAQLETGHLQLAPEPTEPSEITRECVRSMAFMAAQHGVEIEFDPAFTGTVALDPTRLRQVILNYLSNALKFAGRDGRVTVAVSREHDRARDRSRDRERDRDRDRDRDGILVEVSDTGPGIAASDQERVFEEFVALGSTGVHGTGLGLAVTKLIVQAQGGRVGVRSRPGAGATFYAWLPVEVKPGDVGPLTSEKIDLSPSPPAATVAPPRPLARR